MKGGTGLNTATLNHETMVNILNEHFGFYSSQVVTMVEEDDGGKFKIYFDDKPDKDKK